MAGPGDSRLARAGGWRKQAEVRGAVHRSECSRGADRRSEGRVESLVRFDPGGVQFKSKGGSMSIFKRGGVWWYEFWFLGQRIRECAHTARKKTAGAIERKRRKQFTESAGGVRRHKPLLFSVAAKKWLVENAHWSD